MGLLALCLAPLSALMGAALLRPRTWPAFGLMAYVLLLGEIVAIVEALSLVREVTPAAVLMLEAAVAVVLAVLLRRRGYRLPPRPDVSLAPPLQILAAVVAVAIAYELALAVLTPPNNDDSLTYHLSRAAAWYHQHAVGYVHAHSQRQNNNGPNAEILILFTFLFTHGDRLAAVWQWIAELASLAAIYVIALRLHVSRSAAAFAALLFATMPQPALQATSTQNDLVAASLVGAAVAFLTTAERRRYPFAAAALALALGTKLTVAFVLPVVAVLAVKLSPRRDLPRFAGLCAAAFVALGAYVYVLNVLHTGTLQGTGAAVSTWSQHSWPGRVETAYRIPIALLLRTDPTNWDLAYFGVLGPLALLPAVAAATRRAVRSRRLTLAPTLALAIPVFVIGIAAVYRYNPWIGRFMLIPVVLTAPLLALLFTHHRYVVAISGMAIASLFLSLAASHTKPSGLFGDASIWTMSRDDALAIERPWMRAYIAAARRIPRDATIGYSLGEADWDYPLFGQDLGRTLVRLPPHAQLAAAERQRLRWVVLRNDDVGGRTPAQWRSTRLGKSGLTLLTQGP